MLSRSTFSTSCFDWKRTSASRFRGELFPEDLASADAGFVKDGLVTAEGIAALRTKVPHIDIDTFAKDPKVENIKDMFTVQMLIKFVQRKLAA